jgi:hypothetical protein
LHAKFICKVTPYCFLKRITKAFFSHNFIIIKNETQEISKESVTFDLISYIFWVGIGIYLVQKLIPVGDAYQTLRIVLYVMLVLGGGYSAVFLAVLYFLKMQITKK